MNQEVGALESGRDWGSKELPQSCPAVSEDLATPTSKTNTRLGNFELFCARGAIIPSFLDDYGLDPYEMRVYIRLARRAGMGGQCWESVPNMARACLISPQKVKNCLALLSAAHLIKQLKRPGTSNVYELMPECHWVKASELDNLRTQVTAYRKTSDQKRQRLYQQQIPTKPALAAHDYEVADSDVADYEVAATQLRGSCPPSYEVAATQLRGSCPPSYEVATKESLLRNPIKGAHEGIPLTPPTPQGQMLSH